MTATKFLIACSVILLGGCAARTPATAGAAPPAAGAATAPASQRLHALFAASDEGSLDRNPLNALFRGDPRHADQFGDYLSDAYYAAEKAAVEADLAALRSINRAALPYEDQIAYDVFEWQREMDLRSYQPDILAATLPRPLDHHKGFHMLMADISSGSSVVQFKTIEDYENNLKRLEDFTRYLDNSIGRMRQGVRSGIVQPKLVATKMAGQFESMLKLGIEESPYFGPVRKFPENISPADQARLKADYANFIRKRLLPAYQRMATFLRSDYIPHAREAVGLAAMPGGAKLYEYLNASNTTVDMTADQIHRLGLSEVARISAEMEKVKDRVGFKGTLPAFAEFMRSNPQFHAKSADEVRDRYLRIRDQVQSRIGTLFSVLPKTPLDVRAMPDEVAKSASNAFYSQGSVDGARPGIFYFNPSNLSTRVTFDAEALFLHEAIPGHHLQQSLAHENDKLPNFMRYEGNTAYGEGWGLYAESLGFELGLYTDPYQYYGRLTNEIFRAARLVVDTGIHVKGWSREQALSYMVDHTAYGLPMLNQEVDRYIARPGQALAYKIGELTIRRLRTKAEKELGRRFDVRDFHAQVLGTGSLPLPVLEEKIDRWIASKKQS